MSSNLGLQKNININKQLIKPCSILPLFYLHCWFDILISNATAIFRESKKETHI
jgi:hypothetical protein